MKVNFRVILSIIIRHFFPPIFRAINTCKRLLLTNRPIVTIASGTLRGTIATNINDELIYSFQGISYAKPPLGELRFKAPQPVEPWTGIRDADCEGNCSICRLPLFKTLIGSEDCLYLNVYTPNLPGQIDDGGTLKPVMVWIHGGGFTSGSGNAEVYGPEYLLTEDIVLVTINYRLAVLGFLSLKDPELGVTGNAGLKDMVMALKWVQTNIHCFTGDPNNVTIFGESAGAASVHYLMLSPLAKGLFHKAIMQSGCALNVWARGSYHADKLAKNLKLESNDERKLLKALQTMPAGQIFKAAEQIPDPFIACTLRAPGPVVEPKSPEAFMYEEPTDVIKSGNYSHVPMMIGYANREGILSEILQKPKPFRPITDFEVSIPYFLNIERGSDISKMLAKQIKEFYYGDEEPTPSNKEKFVLLQTDNFFLRDILQTIKYHKRSSPAPVFLFRMSIDSGLNMLKKIYKINDPGTCHGDELGYLFKSMMSPKLKPGSEEEMAVKRFVKLWTTFARYGDPNPIEKNFLIDVRWEPVEKDKLNFLDIGKDLKMEINPEPERMAFWRECLKINTLNKL